MSVNAGSKAGKPGNRYLKLRGSRKRRKTKRGNGARPGSSEESRIEEIQLRAADAGNP